MNPLTQAILAIISLWIVRWFWQRLAVRRILDNIPGPESHSFWTGNLAEVFSTDGWNFHQEIVQKYRGVIRIDAPLGSKYLYVFDPKALHQILVKDQDIFEAQDSITRGTQISLGEGILGTLGDQHRKQRKMLNPVFSAAHLRNMFPIFVSVGKRLQATLESKIQNGGPQEIDILLWMSRTALELIGQAGLGHSFDTLATDAVPLYIQSFKNLGLVISRLSLTTQYIIPWAVNIGPPRFRRFIVDILPWKDLHTARDILDTMYATAVNIYNIKKAALQAGDEAVSAQIAQGKDVISVLMKDNDSASSADRLSEAEIIGQLSTFIFAATDTTSSALSRILHLLAQHPDVQEKLRQEIRTAQSDGGELTYDQLVGLPYLDAIARETLRLYPPVSFITRTTRRDAVLTTASPITLNDGSSVTEIPVPRGTEIFVSILSSNRNPEMWGADVLEWKPERWLSPLPKTVLDAHIPGVYSHLMTFNAGGRSCIGFKFSQLEMKVVLSLLVGRFKFSLSEKRINWLMSGIAVPAIDGETRPQLPIKIELAA